MYEKNVSNARISTAHGGRWSLPPWALLVVGGCAILRTLLASGEQYFFELSMVVFGFLIAYLFGWIVARGEPRYGTLVFVAWTAKGTWEAISRLV